MLILDKKHIDNCSELFYTLHIQDECMDQTDNKLIIKLSY